jgi:hypothetical protein
MKLYRLIVALACLLQFAIEIPYAEARRFRSGVSGPHPVGPTRLQLLPMGRGSISANIAPAKKYVLFIRVTNTTNE